MASARRPTYTSPGRAQRGSGGSGSGSGGVPGNRAPAQSMQSEVISASKSAPAADPDPTRGKQPKDTGSKGARSNDAPSWASRRKEKKSKDKLLPGAAAGANVLAFPEPRGRRLKRNIIVTVCTAAALIAGILAAAIFSPLLAVGTITVSGTKLLTPDQVQAALEPLKGKPLPQVSDEEVDRLLEPLVQIKSVTVQARPPSGLVVNVRERVPVALVKQGEQYQLVDVDGVQLAATADPESVSLPVIDGGAGTIGKDLFQATAAVLGALPAEVLAKLSNASAQSVDAVELKLVDGQTIVWGNASERELKAKVLQALLKVPADPKNPVRVYDVSVPRHPVTR
ncbi:FtsQ-type POTRA domain-containing protein [Arthrobacter sp. S39]|uniref:cell division protein FtsQ/DivIB n=1 Tax=Arthrobacter sp. S39 TaxID=2509720 RepID=UPI0010371D8A|nr:FtsQ-type POTRA domain-containing protein [Arthrobacter sp. S39]TAP40547.1 FtsQ-type POTRA domain-containing protein [Arthrobacter sp. S39]